MKPKILIVDDELSVRESLRELLSRDFFVSTAATGKEAKGCWQKGDFSVVILDIVLPDCSGIDLLTQIKRDYPEVPVVMITGTREVRTAVSAMKLGAFDYITKPFSPVELRGVLEKTLQVRAQQEETVRWFKRAQEEVFFGNMVGRSHKMIEVFKRIAQVMHTITTVLIEGESGTGKELIARAIHFHGTRHTKPFVPVHIASLSAELIESELFGHQKGAFTGAVRTKCGTLEMADGGTLFLDEVGDIPPRVQVKLLRVLQEREFHRVGGTKDIKVDVRFIAATNKDLWRLVEEGSFREDLYYRISVIPIKVPPLRERPEDVPVLFHHFIDKLKKRLSSAVKGFSKEALELLKKYDWPGNVRELENLTEQLLLIADHAWVTPQDLPVYVQREKVTPSRGVDSLDESIFSYEKRLIEDALVKSKGVVTKAARLLGTTRRVLKYRMDKLGVDPKSPAIPKGMASPIR